MRKPIVFMLMLSLALLFSCAKQGKVLIPPGTSFKASENVQADGKIAEKHFSSEIPMEKEKIRDTAAKACREEKSPKCLTVIIDRWRVPDKDITCSRNIATIRLEPLRSGIFVEGTPHVKTEKKKFSVFVNGKQVSYKDNLDGTLSFVLD